MDRSELLDHLDKVVANAKANGENISAVLRHIRDSVELSSELNDDLVEAQHLFESGSFEFAARTFVRTMSAEFEARLFLLQQLLLVTNEHCDEKLSAHEETVLRAEAPYIKGNGKLGTSSRFYAFIDNLSFSLQLARKRFGDFVFCSKQDARWNSVLVFVDIRNRLTHPKRIQDLEISEKEVRALNEAQDWLREAFKSVFKHPAMVHAVKQHADVSKLRGEDQGSSFD